MAKFSSFGQMNENVFVEQDGLKRIFSIRIFAHPNSLEKTKTFRWQNPVIYSFPVSSMAYKFHGYPQKRQAEKHCGRIFVC
jgi:hypothetical protein